MGCSGKAGKFHHWRGGKPPGLWLDMPLSLDTPRPLLGGTLSIVGPNYGVPVVASCGARMNVARKWSDMIHANVDQLEFEIIPQHMRPQGGWGHLAGVGVAAGTTVSRFRSRSLLHPHHASRSCPWRCVRAAGRGQQGTKGERGSRAWRKVPVCFTKEG